MAGANPTNQPERDLPAGRGHASSRTMIASLGVVILLLGMTTYMALTDDSFRDRTSRYLSPGSKAANRTVNKTDDVRNEEATAREAALTTEIGALRGSLAAMTVDALALRKANAALTVRERATSARLAIAEEHRLAGVAAAARLGSRMKTRVGKSVARQLATLPGKVLPAIGATVAVASTALELRDLCDGMRDMAALNQAVGLPAVDDRDACGVRIGSVKSVVADAMQNITATYAAALQAAGLKASPPLQITGATPGALVPALPQSAGHLITGQRVTK